MYLKKSKFLVLTISIIIILLTFQSVLAAFFTIDTNDTVIADWAAVPGGIADPNDITRDAVDITFANVAVQGNNPTDYIYFRVTVVGPTAASGANDVFGVYIDCNDDGNAQTASDLLVTYQRATDTVEFRDPTLPPYMAGTPVGNATDGERTDGDSAVDVEWRILKSDLNTQGCANVFTLPLGFQFVGTNGATNIDDTSLGRWDSPTAVGLQEFGASSGVVNIAILVAAAIGLLIASTAGYFARTHKE